MLSYLEMVRDPDLTRELHLLDRCSRTASSSRRSSSRRSRSAASMPAATRCALSVHFDVFWRELGRDCASAPPDAVALEWKSDARS
jgi:hypothetical protein